MLAAETADNQVKSQTGSESQPEPKSDTLPRPFGRLVLLKQLAKGGMGEVYLATSGEIEGAERPCVVKIIRREHDKDKSFLARFLDEARIQAQLQHPGVAQILEAAQSPSGKPFVVVEFVEGRNLSEVRNRATSLKAQISWPEAVALAIALGEALTHVHERTDADGRPLDIVHRDLSPQNVMVGYGGEVKLIDFGTARGENRRSHTVSGVVFAKPGYVAPEVANNNPGGIPADLYAFGIMLWELLSGRRFLSGEASVHLAAVGAGRLNPPPLARLLGAPEEIDAVVTKLTAPRIEDRYASARQATAELVDVLKQAPSLANGERGVRGRIAHVMQRLYPAEPARSRAEFQRLVAEARLSDVRPCAIPELSPAPEKADDAVGTLPGTRYRIVREIGRGGMGVVYEAIHVDLSRTVALKILAKERAENPRWVSRFRTEARAIAHLNHENLVKLHDFGVSGDGRPYYAMELLEGETLASYLDRERGMDWREAVSLSIQACRALEAAHNAGVVHRDIKPANLFLVESGVLKLLDFGVATLASHIETPDHGDGSNPLSLVGTVDYLAPEQAAGLPADHRADIYALGVVLYELLTGSVPFSESSTVALLDAKVRMIPEAPRARAKKRGLPKMVDRVVMKALNRDAENRFQSATEMRKALALAFLEPERARARRRKLAVGSVFAVVLGSSGLLTVSALQPGVTERVRSAGQRALVRLEALSGASAAQVVEEAAKEASARRLAGQHDSPQATPVADQPAEHSTTVRDEETKGDSGAAAEPPSRVETEPAAQQDPVEGRIALAEQHMRQGERIRGFNELRALVQKRPEDPSVLKAWSSAAVMMKAWGDAYRAAVQWVSVAPDVESRLFLARMQRATGRDDHLETLRLLLDDYPDDETVKAAFSQYAADRKLAQR